MRNHPDGKEMRPRVRGLLLVALSAFMVTFNLFAASRLGEYFRSLFPIAGFVLPLGIFLLVRGASVGDLRRGVVSRWVIQAMFVAMLVGLLVGFWANQARFGRAF